MNHKILIQQIEATSPGLLATLKAKLHNLSANSVTFRMPRYKHLQVTLAADDTYSISVSQYDKKAFAYISKGNPITGIYCDNIGPVIAEKMGVAEIQNDIRDTVLMLRRLK